MIYRTTMGRLRILGYKGPMTVEGFRELLSTPARPGSWSSVLYDAPLKEWHDHRGWLVSFDLYEWAVFGTIPDPLPWCKSREQAYAELVLRLREIQAFPWFEAPDGFVDLR